MKDYNNVAILFGRKNSEGFPRKNLYPILGRPAALYPILAAYHSQTVEKIFLSTDDPELVEIGKKYDIIPLDRPDELCTSEALIEDVMQYAFNQVKAKLNAQPKYISILLCNSCNVLAESLDEGVEFLENHNNYDSAITACKLNMYSPLRARKLKSDGTLEPFIPLEIVGDLGQLNCDRDSAGDAYFADGGLTVVRSGFLHDVKNNLLPFRWMGNRIHMIEQEPGGSDIDDYWQVAAMEAWLVKHGFSKTDTPYK
jgi:CMP-N-acetylneuraminic acid synthetase